MATKATSSTSRSKRTKAETQNQFEQVRDEVLASQENIDIKTEELAQLKAAELRQEVESLSVEQVEQRITALRLDTSRALSDLSEKLSSEVNLLSKVRQAIVLEKQELEILHKKDLTQTALDQMIEEYQTTKDKLENEIVDLRTAWIREQQANEQEHKIYMERLNRDRQRDQEEYEYRRTLEQKKAQDSFLAMQRENERASEEKQETLEKNWQQRENELKSKEVEFARLKKESEEFQVRLKKEIDKAVAEALQNCTERHQQQLLLVQKDADSEKRMAELQIQTLKQSLAQYVSQLEAAQKQIDEAKKQVQDIAVKAIEGASGARALSHVNQIAMEQAKTRTTQG